MTISQREARRLRKRVEELEEWAREKRWDWSSGAPFSSVKIADSSPSEAVLKAVEVARTLNHAVIAVPANGRMEYYAVREGSKP